MSYTDYPIVDQVIKSIDSEIMPSHSTGARWHVLCSTDRGVLFYKDSWRKSELIQWVKTVSDEINRLGCYTRKARLISEL